MVLLFEAISSRNPQAVKLLLGAGVDVNAVDLFGQSALFSVRLGRNYDITVARMLLSAGANPSLVDNGGKIASSAYATGSTTDSMLPTCRNTQ
jgi:ankyrin repeat protein